MTKDEFLRDPIRRSGPEVPSDWLAEAWSTVPEFRDNVIYSFVRSVRKDGDLNEASNLPEFLNRFLICRQVVELYEAIRGHPRTAREEYEWHPYFVRAFPQCASALPPRPPRPVEAEEPPQWPDGSGPRIDDGIPF